MNKFKMNKNNKSKDSKNTYKSNKGNYPYPWNNLLNDTTSVDMVHLAPDSVKISKLDDMRDNYVSETKKLMDQYYKLEKEYNKTKKQISLEKYILKYLKKVDLLKINNQLRITEQIQKEDLNNLKQNGLTHTPVTSLGKTIKLLEYLKKFHLDDNSVASKAIYLRLMEEEFTNVLKTHPKLKSQYQRSIDWMNNYMKTQNMVKYQLVNKHELMPPLNQKGFIKLDSWQEKAIDNMRNRKSTILSIPTSGGKTYLSAYLTKSKGKTVFIAPSIPLARQVAAYLTRVTNEMVPYLTDTYQPKIYHNELLETIKNSRVIVSTPDIYLDYLPEIGLLSKDDNLIIDEIHMMGSHQGDSMETIAILNKEAYLLGLSATVSNPEDLIKWRNSHGKDLELITSKERFFNLQTAFWDSKKNQVVNINPLAMLTLEDFISKDILMKELKPTPPDIYQLADIMEKEFGEKLGNLKLNNYFNDLHERRVNLTEVLEYFNKLIKFLTEQDISKIKNILDNFTHDDLWEEETDLLKIITELRETKNIPVLVFERNTYSLMRLAKNLIENINAEENKKYPNRIKQIEKQEKEAKKRRSEMEKAGIIKDDEKTVKLKEKLNLEEINVDHIQKPTPEFNWCPRKYISESEILDIDFQLKKFFPHDGDYLHPIIHALWRGIGIYAEGLPDDYLILVQVMANEKKLGVVLSDKSMTFGVSMPFRNVVIYRDPTTKDDLNPLLFKQMEGRAGRRGIDTKGTVIFAGYSWERIQELTVSRIPWIEGKIQVNNSFLHFGEKLAELSKNNLSFEKVKENNLYLTQVGYYQDNYDYDMLNYKKLFPEMFDDIDVLRMLWRSRKFGNDGIAFYHIVDKLEKHFCNGDISEIKQIEAAHILSFFIQTNSAKRLSEVLKPLDNYETKWKPIKKHLLNLGIFTCDERFIDGRVWFSIQANKLFEGHDDEEYQDIREKFFKFTSSLRILQNYCYYSKRVTLAKILGKLFTRCKWILWLSSPLSNFGKEQVYLKELKNEVFVVNGEDD